MAFCDIPVSVTLSHHTNCKSNRFWNQCRRCALTHSASHHEYVQPASGVTRAWEAVREDDVVILTSL
jgi:hypothetical protein